MGYMNSYLTKNRMNSQRLSTKQTNMARYTGPKTKIARKFGEPIFGEDKSFEKRNYPPWSRQ